MHRGLDYELLGGVGLAKGTTSNEHAKRACTTKKLNAKTDENESRAKGEDTEGKGREEWERQEWVRTCSLVSHSRVLEFARTHHD